MSTDTADSRELEELFDSIALAPRGAPAEPNASAQPPRESAQCGDKVLHSVGQLTRKLHDTLAQLGYDRSLQECAAATLPGARQRIDYVATLTEQAASRTLSAVELATPVQESLAAEATALAGRWDTLFRGESTVEEFKTLATATREYLHAVPTRTQVTREHLREVVMAQEFQDLTGQVLKRVTAIAADVEAQLLKLLVEYAQPPVARNEALGLLNGPAIEGGADVLANQAQVDELLESLGF